ncbi:succinate dehydrogenase assembly factor 2 [Desulfosoma caldarium]|nr:succinate dehydrogenase assembly factor 2 [Desulfosoma caldarium]
MRRRLRYLCRRRATQELELILSRFWEDHANELNEQDLVELEALLSLDDMDLLAMCLGQKPFPSSFRAELTRRLLPAHLIKP